MGLCPAPLITAVAAIHFNSIIIFGDRLSAASVLALNHGALPNGLDRPKEGGGESIHARVIRSVLGFDSVPVVCLDLPDTRCQHAKAVEQQVSQIVGDGKHESEKPVSALRRIVVHAVRAFNQGIAESIKQPTGGITYSVKRGGYCLADPEGVENYPPSISHDDFLMHVSHLLCQNISFTVHRMYRKLPTLDEILSQSKVYVKYKTTIYGIKVPYTLPD